MASFCGTIVLYMFDFSELKQKIKNVEEWLSKELSLIRTGKATPSILDFIQVDAYGSKMSIKELANIIIEDSKTIKVEPWDIGVGKNIEKAVISSNLGLSISPYEKGLRIIFPELTSERREQLIKVARTKLEEGRVAIRMARDKTSKTIDEKEKEGGMGEDDKFKYKEEMQKMVEESQNKMVEMVEKKETEIKK